MMNETRNEMTNADKKLYNVLNKLSVNAMKFSENAHKELAFVLIDNDINSIKDEFKFIEDDFLAIFDAIDNLQASLDEALNNQKFSD